MTAKTVKLTPGDIRELERIGTAIGVTPHALMRRFIRWGIRAVTGTLEDELELEKQRIELEVRRAAILQAAVTKDREDTREGLSPVQAVIAAFNAGDEEGARTRFNELTPRVQKNILLQLQKEAPDLADRLQAAEGDVEDP